MGQAQLNDVNGDSPNKGAYANSIECDKHGCSGRTRYIIKTTHGAVRSCREHKDEGKRMIDRHPEREILYVQKRGEL